jgi:hypothetical protein
VNAGDSFVFRSGSDGYHLWVVISDPLQNDKEVLVVNLTIVRGVRFEDLSCVFEPDEHEWITSRSYVAFDMARHYTDKHLELLRTSKVIREYAVFPGPLLDRIRKAALVTQNLEIGYIELLQQQGLV